jgi:DNA invertase Pin-like site-specific DNA recombinase
VTGQRAAIYVRVSTGAQEEGSSLQSQEAACRSFAAERGYDVDEAHVYAEVHTGVELWERSSLMRSIG